VSTLTQHKLLSLLDYDASTGDFRWRVSRGSVVAGGVAGSPHSRGYTSIRIDGRLYLAHRLAWLAVTGALPVDQLDHINGDKRDNRIANLREASNQTNNQNYRKSKKNSKTGYLGVCHEPRGDSYVAYLRVDGKTRNLGTYKTPEEAHAVYVQAKRQLHEGCTL